MSALLHKSPLPLLLVFVFSSSCFVDLRCTAQNKLALEEVEALRVIDSKIKKNWDFTVEPCSGEERGIPRSGNAIANSVTCGACNDTTNICHVNSIKLEGKNLTGFLPDEFANLTFLTKLDLTRNYLTGTIPATWASLPLTELKLSGNRISGNIPKEVGQIRTLQDLRLEDNLLEGHIPEALGNLGNLNRLHLSANKLEGDLPESLGNLKNLWDLIDGNAISGTIPNFIGNWAIITHLDMQGTSMKGPFPSSFSTLKSISELRVSDWKEGDGKFPSLQSMTTMRELVLRNLSISGAIPDYIWNMSQLEILDLSFNNLTGQIPDNFNAQPNLKYMYLTSNRLGGTLSSWILSSKRNLDLSYNSFTGFTPNSCGQANVNLVSSYSSTSNNSIAPCLMKNHPCQGKAENYELFINCGGSTINDTKYQGDPSSLGPSSYQERGTWAVSNTGNFFNAEENAQFIANNVSVLRMSNPELYMTARLSPLSLKYYGLCLRDGNYTVSLHFAEIVFTDENHTYSSVGRRIFDVSIQGKKVLQDFNIAEEANGTGKVLIKNFTTFINSSTLEIHFQWAGKGTNAVPRKGVYGPLISAISVTSNLDPHLGERKLSVGAIVGIVVAACVVLSFASITIYFCFIRKDPQNNELRGLELQTGYFTLRQIKAATKNFDAESKIGEGGFGSVYKGVLLDGSVIAVKQLSSKSKQGNREFINEVGTLSALRHPNLVKLHGCCTQGDQLLLIYEYMENNSLARALFGPQNYRLALDWQTRRNICIGIARGLAFLHEELRLKIVHRDIKATNILLDKNLNAKISDFGLAKLDEEENTHISTRIAGTVGYMAPEYATRGHLTDKADVYSYGVVTLEIVSGMSNSNFRSKEECVYLLDWAYELQEEGNLLELVDQSFDSNYSKEEALQMLELALVCTNPSPSLRPTMSAMVSMLEGKTPVKITTVNRTASGSDNMRFKALEKLSQESQTQRLSMDAPVFDSSMSATSEKHSQSYPLIYHTQ